MNVNFVCAEVFEKTKARNAKFDTVKLGLELGKHDTKNFRKLFETNSKRLKNITKKWGRNFVCAAKTLLMM